MRIYISKGIGEADTKIIAFHKALREAGVSELNLISLSSVIPKNVEIIKGKPPFSFKRGNIGYVVMARNYEDIAGKEAWSGIGWVYNKDKGGFFVEGDGSKRDEVVSLLKKSLNEIKEIEGLKDRVEEGIEIAGIRCEGKPVCSVVIAFHSSYDLM